MLTEKEINDIMVWALKTHTMQYCLDHMDKVYEEWLEVKEHEER